MYKTTTNVLQNDNITIKLLKNYVLLKIIIYI